MNQGAIMIVFQNFNEMLLSIDHLQHENISEFGDGL